MLVTQLLARWRQGDRSVEVPLMQMVYPVLCQIAQARLNCLSVALTLSATELANETYMRLAAANSVPWSDRNHFYAFAARVTRNFVVDHLRARDACKRGGDLPLVRLDELDEDSHPQDLLDLSYDWIGVHEALNQLETLHRACAQVVELKFFSGMTMEEIAGVCGISPATVGRHWRFARAWLLQRFGGDAP